MVTKMPTTPAAPVLEPVLELTDVHRRTGGTMILKEIDWRIEQGPVSYTHLTLPTICSV